MEGLFSELVGKVRSSFSSIGVSAGEQSSMFASMPKHHLLLGTRSRIIQSRAPSAWAKEARDTAQSFHDLSAINGVGNKPQAIDLHPLQQLLGKLAIPCLSTSMGEEAKKAFWVLCQVISACHQTETKHLPTSLRHSVP